MSARPIGKDATLPERAGSGGTFPRSPYHSVRRVFPGTAGTLAFRTGPSQLGIQLKPAPGIRWPSPGLRPSFARLVTSSLAALKHVTRHAPRHHLPALRLTPNQPPRPHPKRLSLADLREAGRRRPRGGSLIRRPLRDRLARSSDCAELWPKPAHVPVIRLNQAQPPQSRRFSG